LRKLFRTDLNEIFREGWQWANEQTNTFYGDPDHRLDTGIIFRFRHYWATRTVVNGHESAAADLARIRHMAGLISHH